MPNRASRPWHPTQGMVLGVPVSASQEHAEPGAADVTIDVKGGRA